MWPTFRSEQCWVKSCQMARCKSASWVSFKKISAKSAQDAQPSLGNYWTGLHVSQVMRHSVLNQGGYSPIDFETFHVFWRGRNETLCTGCLNRGRKGLTRVKNSTSRLWYRLCLAYQLPRLAKTIKLIGQWFKHSKCESVMRPVFSIYFLCFGKNDLFTVFSIDWLIIS